ncbi:hypothetical protein [Alloyangia mangrovi]|uniref:hypothetical protein n=1 Tax=Alloyangia mangrovi TaxID=1779329 RepID=UPI001140CE93|nr:hypothetical protein [Alloyangia mangrovi]
MPRLNVYFTQGFIQGPPGIEEYGPERKARINKSFLRIYASLIYIGEACPNGNCLALRYLLSLDHYKPGFPPLGFGAFLGDIDQDRATGDCIPFASIDALSDEDEDGYFSRYDPRLSSLHCAILFTLRPSPRLLIFKIGDEAHVSGLLEAHRDAEVARIAIEIARNTR